MRTVEILLALNLVFIIASQSLAAGGEDSEIGVHVSYSWQLDESAEARLFEGIVLLRYGDSISKAKAILGSPTKEATALDKKGNFKAHVLEYAIKRVEYGGRNVKDQEITLNFDVQGRLFQIDYNAMSPLFGEILRSYAHPQTGTKFFFTKPPP